MPGRNAELIRQWTLLRLLATTRTNTIPRLAQELEVSERTVRRDLKAVESAGFPLEETEVNGSKFWHVSRKAMAGLERTGLTFAELSTLYLSRALFECFAESHLLADLQSALDKIEAALSPKMRTFLDQLPNAVTAKSPQVKTQNARTHAITLRLIEAAIDQREVVMRYRSNSSRRTKRYIVHPYRLTHAQGGMYLVAFVPEYGQVRTFAVERISEASADKKTFELTVDVGTDPFADSMGVYRGPTCKVQIRFDPQVAPHVRDRQWHQSQQFKERPDGSLVMTLQVSDDYALRRWILQFGHSVRVLAPASLVEWAIEELDAARAQYHEAGEAWNDALSLRLDSRLQPPLPFPFSRLEQ